jgi:hypothetical protein
MKKLPERWSEGTNFKEWLDGEKESEEKSYKKFSLIDRFGELVLVKLLNNMIINKSDVKSELRRIVKPYDNFPMPYIMYATLNEASYKTLVKDNKGDDSQGFNYSNMFKININSDSLKSDDYKDWSKSFEGESKENLKNLITYLTPVIRTGEAEVDFTSNEAIPKDERILSRIFKVSKASQSRTSISSPFSMIMFLPTIKGQNVGQLCKALSSLFLTISFWKNKFVFLTLSETPKQKGGYEEDKVNMSIMNGGSYQEYKDCSQKGVCTWEELS